jgi:type II protein arginine methyltransferase
METPYVVMFEAVNILSGDGGGPGGWCGPQIQECWEFEHPKRDAVLDERGKLIFILWCADGLSDFTPRPVNAGLPPTNSLNARAAKLKFHIPHAGVLHGLAGYFEAVLYGNVGLSIHPHRKERISKDMLSWFPLFFPLKVRVVLSCPPWLRGVI